MAADYAAERIEKEERDSRIFRQSGHRMRNENVSRKGATENAAQ
jgi:hypothetical protein